MWTLPTVGLLALATAEGVALALLAAERHRTALALRELQAEVRAVLDAAERAADAGVEEVPASRPIGFRRA